MINLSLELKGDKMKCIDLTETSERIEAILELVHEFTKQRVCADETVLTHLKENGIICDIDELIDECTNNSTLLVLHKSPKYELGNKVYYRTKYLKLKRTSRILMCKTYHMYICNPSDIPLKNIYKYVDFEVCDIKEAATTNYSYDYPTNGCSIVNGKVYGRNTLDNESGQIGIVI